MHRGTSACTTARPTLLLSVKGSRYCDSVGRQHRSNGVYLLVDVLGGTWVQRCHDPDCRAYASHTRPLPPNVWQLLRAQTSLAADVSG